MRLLVPGCRPVDRHLQPYLLNDSRGAKTHPVLHLQEQRQAWGTSARSAWAHAAQLLHSQLAGSRAAGGPASAPALDLAAALMAAGLELAEDAECLAMLRAPSAGAPEASQHADGRCQVCRRRLPIKL